MTISQNKVVAVHYTLNEGSAEGQLVESTNGGNPLEFIFGIGMMIPAFEENLKDLKMGDTFAFGIPAAQAYGEYDDNALVEVPKQIFEHEGKIPDGLLEVGNVLPLQESRGQPPSRHGRLGGPRQSETGLQPPHGGR
jgi:FKBP-type peptidyl-prolyl cis-trans isomerases 2